MKKNRVTIKDIAKALNMNISTVSRALNNHSRISTKTKAIVLEKAKSMGYQVNHIARQLRGGQSRIIGLIVPRINRVFFSNVIHGVESVAKKLGYQILIYQSNDSAKEEWEGVQALLTQNVAGMIVSLASDSTDKTQYHDLLLKGVPLVMFDRVFSDLEVSSVLNANRKGGFQATKHLIEQGYQNIVYFGGNLDINIYRDRFQGYCDALSEAKLPILKENICHNVLTQHEGETKMLEFLTQQKTFDALFSASDYAALGAILVLKKSGFKIPQEVGIVGFANEPFTELLGITSLEQYSIKMGENSAQLLLEQIKTGQVDAMQKNIVISPKLLIRDSSMKKSFQE